MEILDGSHMFLVFKMCKLSQRVRLIPAEQLSTAITFTIAAVRQRLGSGYLIPRQAIYPKRPRVFSGSFQPLLCPSLYAPTLPSQKSCINVCFFYYPGTWLNQMFKALFAVSFNALIFGVLISNPALAVLPMTFI